MELAPSSVQDIINEMFAQIPALGIMDKIVPLVPALQRLVARHDQQLALANSTGGVPVERYRMPRFLPTGTRASTMMRLTRYAKKHESNPAKYQAALSAIGEMNSSKAIGVKPAFAGNFGQTPSSAQHVEPHFVERNIGLESTAKFSALESKENVDRAVRRILAARKEGKELDYKDVLEGNA